MLFDEKAVLLQYKTEKKQETMLLSMTGYGRSSAVYGGKTLHCEVKALNSKALDMSARIAPLYREKEIEIRRMAQESVVRGKVDIAVWAEQDSDTSARLNVPVIKAYYDQLRQLQAGAGEQGALLPVIMRLPDVVGSQEQGTLADDEWAVCRQVVAEALQHLQDFRAQEGAALRRKFEEKLDNIAALLAQIEPYERGRVEKIRQRLVDALAAIPEADYDQGRLEQEMIFYIEKLDISEEKQRLANHLRYFRQTLDAPQSQGKKLGFIAQEMGREINTTGSKSNQAEMQNIVVQMKDELEQIKEQVLNAL